jgi:hypothetical protein
MRQVIYQIAADWAAYQWEIQDFIVVGAVMLGFIIPALLSNRSAKKFIADERARDRKKGFVW